MNEAVLQQLNTIFSQANFETLFLENYSSKGSKFCFDFLVKKNNMIFSVKVFPNIDNINPEILDDIKTLSILLKSRPLLIGIRNRYQKLEDNTVYMRENLPFITINTLDNILKNKYPYVLARRGGGVTFLNGELMKSLREQQSISRKDLSEKLGVAKRTVCAYENESMRPSEQIAQKLIEILEIKNQEILKKIDVLGWNFNFSFDGNELKEAFDLTDFESHIQEVIHDIGISTYWYKKGAVPFKLSIYTNPKTSDQSDNFYPIFSGISDDKNKMNELNIKCLKIFNELFHKNAVFIINNDVKISAAFKNDLIPIIKIRDLEEIDDEEEFIGLVQDS